MRNKSTNNSNVNLPNVMQNGKEPVKVGYNAIMRSPYEGITPKNIQTETTNKPAIKLFQTLIFHLKKSEYLIS